jgi:MoaA/NifB/PqqE/SkfB family radical SAM enzyme
MSDNKKHNRLHIELTSRCTLACPACARTVWNNLLKTPIAKNDLDIDSLEKFLDCEKGRNIDRFLLCGDLGDPIYYPHLFDFIKRFRDTKTFDIRTNGSYQTESFWKTLASLLGPNDTVIFGIDGLEDTNHLYRRNSDWNSIMLGVDIMSKSSAKVLWQTIIFKYNQDSIAKIQEFAESKGAIFFTKKSHRFNDDTLIPEKEHVETQFLFKHEYDKTEPIKIVAICDKERVITSDGYFFPCNWIRHPQVFYKSELWKQKAQWLEKLKLDNTNLDQALITINEWGQYVEHSGIHDPAKVSVICKMKCREGCHE